MKTSEQLKAENQAIRNLLASGLEARLLAIPGVMHVSVGLKEKNGQVTDLLCIRVYVKEKRGRDKVSAAELIPVEIDGVSTDVNTVGQFTFQVDNTRYRPIKGGIQITNRIIDINSKGTGTRMSKGTLGCIAIDNTDNTPVVLSNWHVLYANTGTENEKVFQPGPTILPTLDETELPFRPPDDTDKIGVIRRGVISEKVDAAVASIDVSSCCNCCGIHYVNEINGLSEAGRPPRNTIIGDERAVSGMTVFKAGQMTLRTEGLIIDDNYPPISITLNDKEYSFSDQIAIQNVNHAEPFSSHGDSGSVVVNLQDKIVGLVFAGGSNIQVGDTVQPFVSLANHISDVLSALNISIPYSPDAKTLSGAVPAGKPTIAHEAPIAEPYRAFRERLLSHENTTRLFALGQRHSEEVTHLVNHCRPVTVAWHRNQGPALLATVMNAIRDRHYKLPQTINGVALIEALTRMRAILKQHGSSELKETLHHREVDRVIDAFRNCSVLNEVIERIVTDRILSAWFQRACI